MPKKKNQFLAPALQFISSVSEPAAPETATDNDVPATAPVGGNGRSAEECTYNTGNADNPDDAHTKTAAPARRSQTKFPAKALTSSERKTRRLNLLLQPSVVDGLTKVAYMQQTSINDLINTILKDYTKKNRKAVKEYDAIFGGKE